MEQTGKIRVLLLALYEHKYNGRLYELGELFLQNGTRADAMEIGQITQLLSDEGLLKTLAIGDTIYGQITVDGVEYLEENILSGGSHYQPKDRIKPLEHEKLLNKLDELYLMLQNSSLGAKTGGGILTLEVEELKSLLSVLGKRNWLQLLKGKLLELSMGQISYTEIELLLEKIDTKHSAEGKPDERMV